ncbi:hypothetical protein HGRIS_009167 [Hohenbuehelia grisea]|uniref:HMG box domain-containing protein n=1 Tax=Hohenbuehelia grisea TaxID=104357 RepID=A0ABR3J0I9_9AGAR
MANILDEGARLEAQKIQLAASLNAVAETMRNCANMAEQFASVIKHSSFQPNASSPDLGHAPAPVNFGDAPEVHVPVPHQADVKPRKRKASTSEEVVEDGRKKRSKKPKDPDAPKRFPSSYILFQNEVRNELKQKHPGMPNSELLSLISQQWKALPEEQRAKYNQMMASAKAQYTSDKKAYDNRSPEEIAAAHAAAEAAAAVKKPRKPRAPKVPKGEQGNSANGPAIAAASDAHASHETGSESGDDESGSEDSSADDAGVAKAVEGSDSDSSEDDDSEDEEPAKPAHKRQKVDTR